ncbi:hypothetical protein Tco_0300132 [Tanacetum coccineum]
MAQPNQLHIKPDVLAGATTGFGCRWCIDRCVRRVASSMHNLRCDSFQMNMAIWNKLDKRRNQHLLLISRWTKWLVKQGELTFQIPEMRFEMKKRGRDIVDYDKHLTLVNEGEHNFQIDKTPLLRLTISPIERIKCSTLLTWNTNSPNEQADDVLNSFGSIDVGLYFFQNLTWIHTSGTNGIPMVLSFLRYDLGRNSYENRVTAKQSPKWRFIVTSIDQRDVV